MIVMLVVTVAPMAVVMILAVPVAFMVLPAFLIVVIVRVAPIPPFVRRPLPMSRDPAIAMTLGSPVAFDPDESGPWKRHRPFVAQGWRRGSDVDRNLSGSGDSEGDCEQHAVDP